MLSANPCDILYIIFMIMIIDYYYYYATTTPLREIETVVFIFVGVRIIGPQCSG